MNQTDPVPIKVNEGHIVYDSALRRSPALEEVQQLSRYRHLIAQWVRRDIITRYKRSVLGVAWTMLNPLGTTLVLAVVFSKVFGDTLGGYAAYVLTGLIPWIFFSQTTNAAMTTLLWGGSLIKRIYVPRTAFAVAGVGTGLVNLLLSLVPLVLVISLFGNPPTWTILALPLPILFLAMFALGFGLLISRFAVLFADVLDMYQVVLTAWMYLSPVIYKIELVPSEFQWLVRLNPMYYLINYFRGPIYDGRLPRLEETLLVGGISLFTLMLGWWAFSRRADELAYRV